MAADQAYGGSGPRRWSTGLVCTLAFVAVVNLAITCVRVASTGTAGRAPIRLAVYRIIGFWLQVPIGLAIAAAMQLGPRRHASRVTTDVRSDVAAVPASS